MKLNEVLSEKKLHEITGVVTVGIDIGSRSAKGALIRGDEIFTAIIPTGFYMKQTTDHLLRLLFKQSGADLQSVEYIVGTGYGRIALDIERIPTEIVTEISCHGLGAHFLGDDIRTIVDIGGQDSKAIKIDPSDGKAVTFVMNDKCAAGTGRFLEKMANVLGHDVINIGNVSLTAENPVTISSHCVVFAESEIISGRARGETVQDLAMGIHVSVAKRINNLLNRVGIEEGVMFTGGVSNNVGMRHVLEEIMGVKMQIPKVDAVFTGSIGAALYAQRYAGKQVHYGRAVSDSGGFRLDLTHFENSIEKRKEEYIHRTAGTLKNAAYLCAYTPVELLSAANVSHIRLFHAGNHVEVSSGERLTQSVFCDMSKSIIGKFQENDPLYGAVDKVYTFYTCDCMKKVAEAIDNNFVPTAIYNLPRIPARQDSADYFRKEIMAFKKDLEQLTGREIQDEKVREQIVFYNRARKLYRAISAYRKRPTPAITSTEFRKLALGYYYIPAEELIGLLEDVLKQLERMPVIEKKAVKFLVAGGIMAEGDREVTGIVEEKLGAYIAVEDNCNGFKPFIEDVPESGDVYDALTRGYLNKAPCIRMKPLETNIELAAELAKEYRVDGVLFYYLKFCPGYSIAKNEFNRKFRSLDLPVLEIPNDYAENDEGQLLTRIEAFSELIRERRR
jgi:predicted CoA-substrate-specific enzyme activase